MRPDGVFTAIVPEGEMGRLLEFEEDLEVEIGAGKGIGEPGSEAGADAEADDAFL